MPEEQQDKETPVEEVKPQGPDEKELFAELDSFFQETAAKVTLRLQQILQSRQVSNLTDMALYAVGSGKKLRPGLSILVYRSLFGNPTEEKHILDIASMAELLHASSLIIDNVVDSDKVRRGKTSAHILYGGAMSMVGAGSLFVLALKIGLSRSNEISGIALQMAEDLINGNEMDVVKIDFNHEQYYKMIELKTVSLFVGATRLGAIMANAMPPIKETCRLFGYHVGMAFQIMDDLVDLYNSKASGMPTGCLLEAKPFLPLIHLYETNPEVRPLLERYRGGTQLSADEWEALYRSLDEAGSVKYTEDIIEEHIKKAEDLIRTLPDNHYRKLMLVLPRYTQAAIRRDIASTI